MEKKIGVCSPKVKGNEEVYQSETGWAGVGTGRKAKWLSGGKLENEARIAAGCKGGAEIA